MARPIALWGNPDSATFVRAYIEYVSFMGKRIPWHKWAIGPLMAVQADIIASGVKYHWDDLQTYNNRNIAGTHIKSNHAWALAIDINPAQNPWQKPLKTDIPVAVRDAFTRHGFRWGGTYSKPDAMHFEYLGLPVKERQEEDDMTIDEVRKIVREEIAAAYPPEIAEVRTHLDKLGVLSKSHTGTKAASVTLVATALSRALKLVGK
jgi:hypothetical protein